MQSVQDYINLNPDVVSSISPSKLSIEKLRQRKIQEDYNKQFFHDSSQQEQHHSEDNFDHQNLQQNYQQVSH